MEQSLAIAAIRFGDGDRVDDVLESVVRQVRARGHAVAGCLQRETPEEDDCCAITHLEDLATGEKIRISQALGRGAKGCRLDPAALAEVSGIMLGKIGPGTGLLVVNRFGKGESDGQGLRAVIEAACEIGIPVLTAVRSAYESAWLEFTGGGTLLPADPK
ncbi:MAG: DUF2478 domain-containing protein, partial [Oricola sp.]